MKREGHPPVLMVFGSSRPQCRLQHLSQLTTYQMKHSGKVLLFAFNQWKITILKANSGNRQLLECLKNWAQCACGFLSIPTEIDRQAVA